MYQQYWNLSRSPFRDDLGTASFFGGRTHQAALLKLRYLVEQSQGAGLLAGTTGCGKTYLVGVLAEQFGEQLGPIVHVVFPQLAAEDLLVYITARLGAIPPDNRAGLAATVRGLENRLTALTEEGRHPLIVVDDAHLIEDRRVLQMLQQLLNLQHVGRAGFTLLLLGQPELLGQLARVGELNERLTLRCLLQPLTQAEVADYIATRLQAAGATRPLFDDRAQQAVFEHSGGVPRRINRLCDLGLLIGFADQLPIVTAAQIEAVAGELGGAAAA